MLTDPAPELRCAALALGCLVHYRSLPLLPSSPTQCAFCFHSIPGDCSSSFEDLVLVNGRLRWSRLENLFKEGSKSQDYDPAQVGIRCPFACYSRAHVAIVLG